jgi:hypothetical protein
VFGFLLAGAALVVTAALAAAALRMRSTATYLLACWIVVCAEVVAASEVLSLRHAIRPLGYVLFEVGALALATAAWVRRGRPLPPRPRAWRIGPLPTALAFAVIAGAVYELFVATASAPNNWDSMHYHLARVAAWHAHHTLAYFPTHNGIENAYPQNAELLVLWTIVFLGRDLFAALPQLLAGLATAVAVYVSALRIGADRRCALFSGLLFPTLTIVALESMTTQNDLVEASFVAAAVAFALGRTRAEVALAGVALGLAAGTKLDFLYVLPALAVIGLLVLPRRRLAEVVVAGVAGFALVGMYAYVQNIAEKGRPQGKASQISALQPDVTLGGTVSSVARTTYRMIDVGGFHVPGSIRSHVAGAAKRVFDGLHIAPNPAASTKVGTFEFTYATNAEVSEDSSALGPLGFLLLIPLSVGVLVAWALRRTGRVHGAFALALPLYVLTLALGTRWNLYVDRFLATPAALTLVLAPLVVRRVSLRIVALLLAAATLGLALRYDPSKPPGVWNESRAAVQAIRWPELRPVLDAVQARVPMHARLGVDLAPLDWEYPWWGPRLGRDLVWLPQQSSSGLDWVLLGTRMTQRPPGRWCAQRFPTVHWTLLRRCQRRRG